MAKKSEAVGYKQPPKETRFKPGQSGNPNGRPPRVRSFADDVADELSETVKVTLDGHDTKVTKQRLIAKGLVRSALNMNTAALNMLVKFMPGEDEEVDNAPDVSAGDQAILDKLVDEEIQRRNAKVTNQ